jgi:hypothetical protein
MDHFSHFSDSFVAIERSCNVGNPMPSTTTMAVDGFNRQQWRWNGDTWGYFMAVGDSHIFPHYSHSLIAPNLTPPKKIGIVMISFVSVANPQPHARTDIYIYISD